MGPCVSPQRGRPSISSGRAAATTSNLASVDLAATLQHGPDGGVKPGLGERRLVLSVPVRSAHTGQEGQVLGGVRVPQAEPLGQRRQLGPGGGRLQPGSGVHGVAHDGEFRADRTEHGLAA